MSIVSKLRPVAQLSKSLDLKPALAQSQKLNFYRFYASQKESRSLAKGEERAEVSTDVRPLGEKIKETTKTVSYTGIILAGVGVTGVILYYVFRELFSSNSANSIYSVALEKCRNVSYVL